MTSVEQLIGGRIGVRNGFGRSRGRGLGPALSDRVSVETLRGIMRSDLGIWADTPGDAGDTDLARM